MYIIADENIPYVQQAFASVGEVHTVAGRNLTATHVAVADILLVRSITPVTSALLAQSHVRFVGTATIGFDHVDQQWLAQQGIGFASAPGCNATAAAEYVISALLVLAQQQDFRLADKSVGIIGCGNVGSRVLHKLTALGVQCLCHDPPRAEREPTRPWAGLSEVLQTDIVTVHVPLTDNSLYPTAHFINRSFLRQLKPHAILINTARGAILDETAWLTHTARPVALFDVWPNEPRLHPDTVASAALATPHIAGYSFDGKVRGTEMLAAAVADYFQLGPAWQARSILPPPPVSGLTFSDSISDEQAIYQAVTVCYDPRRDDAALRRSLKQANPAAAFDLLRKQYPIRREFATLTVTVPAQRTHLAAQLAGLGFQVVTR